MSFRPTIGASFHVVLRGRCWMLTDHADPLPLIEGDVVFLKSAPGHGLADDPSTPLLPSDCIGVAEEDGSPVGRITIPGDGPWATLLCGAYQLPQPRAHPLLRGLPDVVRISAGRSADPAIRAAVDLLRAEVQLTRPGMHGTIPALIDVLLHFVLREWLEEQSAGRGHQWAAALADPAVAPAVHAVHDDPAHPWTVESLAAQGSLSRAAFARRFTKIVGEPPLTYVTRCRMTGAGRLLRESDLALSAVAERVGYHSEYAFARAFKREFGCAPGRYRAIVRSPVPDRRATAAPAMALPG